jgi:isoleucyl-tRNA synthetase
VIPFFTEKLYLNLVRSVDPEAPESVHHTDFPQYDAALHDETVAREMDVALKVVSMALSVRESKSLRVRQPLSELVLVSKEEADRAAVERFESHILEELNIKGLRMLPDTGELVEFSVKPDGRKLGPKYGKDLGAITKALAEADPAEVAGRVRAGERYLLAANGSTFDLEPDEVIVSESFPERYAAGEDRGLTVLLDVTVTPELLREGFARDVVRHIQTMRRDLDLDLTDRIAVRFDTEDEVLAAAVAEHSEYIAGETLADSIEADGAAEGKEVKLQGRTIRLAVERP